GAQGARGVRARTGRWGRCRPAGSQLGDRAARGRRRQRGQGAFAARDGDLRRGRLDPDRGLDRVAQRRYRGERRALRDRPAARRALTAERKHPMIMHIASFRWRDDVTAEDVAALTEALTTMAEGIPALRSYLCGENLHL